MKANAGESQKKVHIVSLGCPKNLVDSEIMLGSMMKSGYQVTEAPEEADTIIVNTCGFIEDAKKESISKILEMAEVKEDTGKKKLLVTGCLTQRYKDELVKEMPEVDAFIGSGEFQNIEQILNKVEESPTKKDFFHLPTYLQEESTPRVNSGPFYRSYIKISEGCKKRCAFCSIPHIRGNLQSREVSAVVNEAKLLVAGGVREAIIISHDFTDYGWDLRKRNPEATETPLALLEALSDVEGLDWIRVLYLYPDGVNQDLIDLMKEKKSLVRYFDMPLQHINNEVLKRMNRRMTREMIEEAVSLIRRELPDAVIRTQFIVGFPGETEEQFEELLEFVEEMEFDRVGCFQYSKEEGTKAATLDGQVPEEIKQERHDRLMALQKEISREKHQQYIGKTLPVLVEGVSEETDLLLQGRFSLQAPEIDGVVYINEGTAEIGEIVDVEITESLDYDLVGTIVRSKVES